MVAPRPTKVWNRKIKGGMWMRWCLIKHARVHVIIFRRNLPLYIILSLLFSPERSQKAETAKQQLIMEEATILIIGAGPSGLALGALLARMNIKVL